MNVSRTGITEFDGVVEGVLPAMAAPVAVFPKVGDLLELGKARLSALVLMTTLTGYLLASVGPIDWTRLALTLLGTGLAALGANAFNQAMEVDRDRRMLRTRRRPIPAGRVTLAQAFAFACICGIVGPLLLTLTVNPVSGLLASLCLGLYVVAYTPLKLRTTMNTVVGAVCGALPPMIGWAAVTGALDPAAWILGLVLFVWQMPHFLALAWLYREDYERGGFRMLPSVDPSGALTFRCVVLFTLALIPATLMLTFTGVTGAAYAIGAALLGLLLLWLALRLHASASAADARRVFLASVIYLPVLLTLMVMDRAAPRLSPEPSSAVVAQVSQ